jgi:hypothetical protein
MLSGYDHPRRNPMELALLFMLIVLALVAVISGVESRDDYLRY